MLGASSFSQSCYYIQIPLQYPTKIYSSTSVNFDFPIPPLLAQKSLQSPLILPFSITQLYSLSNNLHQKIFSLPQPFSQFRLRQGTNELRSLVRADTVLNSSFFLKVWRVITGLTIGMANYPLHLLSYPQPIVISSMPY